MKIVGIIGAGAAGLCATRAVMRTECLTPITWERGCKSGGTWVYTDEIGCDSSGFPIHSSMYKNLRTNLAKEVMGFQEFPFPRGGTSFIPHGEVLRYLESYESHFNLTPFIKYRHHVEMVEPLPEKDGEPKWIVRTKDLSTNLSSDTICDAIILCNGHYSEPHLPAMSSFDKFGGSVMHSHDYRDAERYRGERVLALGGGVSGLDISLELSHVAKEVYWSHKRQPLSPTESPSNWHQVKAAVEARENGFILSDGTFVEVDAILFCTGYKYSFPFLSESCGIQIVNNQVQPLYKHLIHARRPSMALLGIPTNVCPFPFFEFQVEFFVQTLQKKVILPSSEDMQEDTRLEFQRRLEEGIPERQFHKFGPYQWPYCDELAEQSGMIRTKKEIRDLFHAIQTIRNKKILTYRETDYSLDDETINSRNY